jgi:hypothetical protein
MEATNKRPVSHRHMHQLTQPPMLSRYGWMIRWLAHGHDDRVSVMFVCSCGGREASCFIVVLLPWIAELNM